MKLWTVWSDYGASGSGVTLHACAVVAATSEAAVDQFIQAYPGAHTAVCEVVEGVARNRVTEMLFSERMLKTLDSFVARPGRVVAQAMLYIG